MSDREKLIELVEFAERESFRMCDGRSSCTGCEYREYANCRETYCVDHLISNGVTVQTGLRSPFENDIFALTWKAFKNLYPEKDCQCFWEPRIRDEEDGTEVYGLTDWDEDGNISVFVKPELSVLDAAEIFAHELAHVAVGCDAGHGKEWENAFDKIFEEYNRLGDELFDTHDSVSVTDGKAYVTEPPKECE